MEFACTCACNCIEHYACTPMVPVFFVNAYIALTSFRVTGVVHSFENEV